MTPFPLIDLPEAERQAMRLDGEAYRLGSDHVPLAIPDSPAVRAAIVLRGYPDRLAASHATAAWVWGAIPDPPLVPEFLVDLGARWRPPHGAPIAVIESIVRPGDLVRLGETQVTSPLRTVLDLARFREIFGPAEEEASRRLAEAAGFAFAEVERALNRGRNLSGKRRARDRLAAALGPLALSRS